MPLVEDPRVDLVSFTGSAATGRLIAEAAGRRLAKTVTRARREERARRLRRRRPRPRGRVDARLGLLERRPAVRGGEPDRRLRRRLRRRSASASRARRRALGRRARSSPRRPWSGSWRRSRLRARAARPCSRAATRVGERGWHVAPTVARGRRARRAALLRRSCSARSRSSTASRGFEEAVALVNDSPYGLTAAIHTASVHRAMRFAEQVAAGVVVVNAGTHGSEPHMGFGGVKQSGTGWKEAGVEALDVYSETQYVNLVADPGLNDAAGRRARRGRHRRACSPRGRARVCVGTERTVAAIRGVGADARPGRDDDAWRVPRPSSGSRARRPARRRGQGLRPRRRPRPDRARGARRRRRAPAAERPRARRGDPRAARASATESSGRPIVAAGSIGRVEASRRSRGSSSSGRPARRRDRRVARARRHGARRALEPLRVPGHRGRASATDERAVLWEKAARLAVLAAATVASGARSRAAP